MTISTAVLRLADVVARRHQQLALALADDRDRLGRHAVAHQSVLDRVGATQRQRHVVGFRTRRVGVAGRRDAGATLRLEGVGRLLDRRQRLGRQVRAVPVEEHHERRRRHDRRRRWRRRRSRAELQLNAGEQGDVVVAPGRAVDGRVGRAEVTAIEVEAEVGAPIVADAEDALKGKHRAVDRPLGIDEADACTGADIGHPRTGSVEVIQEVAHDRRLLDLAVDREAGVSDAGVVLAIQAFDFDARTDEVITELAADRPSCVRRVVLPQDGGAE